MKVIVPNKLELLSCNIAETGTLWNAEDTYAKGKRVRHEHVLYDSLIASNRGNIPSETYSGENAAWKKIGATNPYMMLDDYVETQTVAPLQKNLKFTVPFNRATALALLNMEGSYVRIRIWDNDDAAYIQFEENGNKTYIDVNLIEDISSLSLWEYCYEPIAGRDTYVRTGLPLVINGRLEVTIYPGNPPEEGEADDTEDETAMYDGRAKCGHVLVGREHNIGYTKYDAEVGITDYSRKVTDEFGTTTFVKRSWAKTASLALYLHPDKSNTVTKTLTGIRATPCLFVGDNQDTADYRVLSLYGWIEDWRCVFSGPNEVELNLDIQGLI